MSTPQLPGIHNFMVCLFPPSRLCKVVLYSLPELDGAIDTVVLGGLVGDTIGLVPERVRKMNQRIKGWVTLRRTPPSERKIAVVVYGFPPNVGAVRDREFIHLVRGARARDLTRDERCRNSTPPSRPCCPVGFRTWS